MQYQYRTRGTCSSRIDFEIEDGCVTSVTYIGGCNGNRLVAGLPVEEVIEKLQGIRCGMKDTSCPDQLAKALTLALEKAKEEK